MSSQWHYSKGGEQLGPVSSERLRELAASGGLLPADLVWKEGLPEWRPASTLKGLFPDSQAKPAGPPPLPHTATLTPPVAPTPRSEGLGSPQPRKPDLFDRARSLA